LPKGASAATIAAGKKLLAQLGEAGLAGLCKLHFKTLDAILGKSRE
jgi:ribonuclease HIII